MIFGFKYSPKEEVRKREQSLLEQNGATTVTTGGVMQYYVSDKFEAKKIVDFLNWSRASALLDFSIFPQKEKDVPAQYVVSTLKEFLEKNTQSPLNATIVIEK